MAHVEPWDKLGFYCGDSLMFRASLPPGTRKRQPSGSKAVGRDPVVLELGGSWLPDGNLRGSRSLLFQELKPIDHICCGL